MKKWIYCLGVILCLYTSASATPNNSLRALQPGDTLPIPALEYIAANAYPKTSVSELKGKLVILDFWNTWCSTCIEAFPKLDSLQKAYGERIAVILVTNQPMDQVLAFSKKHPIAANRSYLSISGDSLLRQYFPCRYQPHEVWLQSGSVVYAITGATEVTAAAIQAGLNGQPYTGRMKLDFIAFKENVPFLQQNLPGINSQLQMQSTLLGPLEGLTKGEVLTNANGINRRYFINMPLLEIFQSLVPLTLLKRKTVFEVRDASKYLPPENEDEEWMKQHSYCYEISMPETVPEAEMKRQALRDISSRMHLETRVEKTLISCYVLKRKTGIRFTPLNDEEALTAAQLVAALNRIPMGVKTPLFLDETGLSIHCLHPVEPEKITGIYALTQVLRKQGLELIKTKRLMGAFIVADERR